MADIIEENSTQKKGKQFIKNFIIVLISNIISVISIPDYREGRPDDDAWNHARGRTRE